IHKLDWRALGLELLGPPGPGTDPIDRQLAYWARYLEWTVRGRAPQPILAHALAWLREHRYAPRHVALCWGDARLPNLIYRNDEVVGVLDWEMAFLGDPEADLGWWLFMHWATGEGYGFPPLEGFPGREETIRRYEALTGRPVEHAFYNEVLAALRFGAIMARIAGRMADLGIPAPMAGLLIEWLVPRESFRLRYRHGTHGMDVVWQAISPTYLYPHPPGVSFDQFPGHIEQGGAVRGTVTLAAVPYPIDCLGHRDHSWGGERDWAKFHRWNYLSGELGRDFWFNAVRIDLGPETDIRVGCLWDGRELLALAGIELAVGTADGGARQLGVDARLTDERGREHHVVGEEVLVNCPVQYGRTWLKDGITRYRCGDRMGFGILEHGYVERAGRS